MQEITLPNFWFCFLLLFKDPWLHCAPSNQTYSPACKHHTSHIGKKKKGRNKTTSCIRERKKWWKLFISIRSDSQKMDSGVIRFLLAHTSTTCVLSEICSSSQLRPKQKYWCSVWIAAFSGVLWCASDVFNRNLAVALSSALSAAFDRSLPSCHH